MAFSKLDALASVAELIGGKDERNDCDTQKRYTRRRATSKRMNEEAGGFSVQERRSVCEYENDYIEANAEDAIKCPHVTETEAVMMEIRSKTSRRFAPVAWKGAQQHQRLLQQDFAVKSSNSGRQEGHTAVSEKGEAGLEQHISATISLKRSLQCQAFPSPFDADGTRVPHPVAKRRNASSASGLLLLQQQNRYPSPTISLSRADMENGDCKPLHLREIRDIQQQTKHKPHPRAPSGGLPRWSATRAGPDKPCSGNFAAAHSADAALGGTRIRGGNLGIATQPADTGSLEHKGMLAMSLKTATETDQPRTSPRDGTGQGHTAHGKKQGHMAAQSPHDLTATAVKPAPDTAVVTATATSAEVSQAADADPAMCLSMMAQSPSKGGPDLLEKMRIAETLLMHRDKLSPQLVQMVIKQLAVLCQSASVDDLVARMAKPGTGGAAPANVVAPSGSVHALAARLITPAAAPVATGAPVGNADEHGGSATSSSSSSSKTAPNGTERCPAPAVATGSTFATLSTRPLATAASLDLPPPSSHLLQPRCATMTSMPPPKVAGATGYGPYGSSTGLHPTATAGRSLGGRRGMDSHFFPRAHPYTHPNRIQHYHLNHQQEQHKIQAPLCTVLQEQQQAPQCGTVQIGGNFPVMTRGPCMIQQQRCQEPAAPTVAADPSTDATAAVPQAQEAEQLQQGAQQQCQAALDMTAIPKGTMDMLIKAIAQRAKSLISTVSPEDATNVDLRGVAAAALLLQQVQQYQQQQQSEQQQQSQQQSQQQQKQLGGLCSSARGHIGSGGGAVDALPPPPAQVLSCSGQLRASEDGGGDSAGLGRAASSCMAHEFLYNPKSGVGASASPPLQQQQQQSLHGISPIVPTVTAPSPRRSTFVPAVAGNAATGPSRSMMWGATPTCAGCVSAAGAAASPDALMPPPFAPSSAASAAVSTIQLRRSTSAAAAIPQAILSGEHSRHAATSAPVGGLGWSPLMASGDLASGLSRSLSGDRSSTAIAGRPISPDAFVTIRLSEAAMQAGVVVGKTISPPPPSPTFGMS
ncbi:hypothetical protein Vretimale_6557 [Volvox reticuliferus]|uniref:Uncharacterized protein n=1 Tax=Volvox reticuliferus TaxID=1737510 RepID=A0A8J4FND7_9CHLO|nr:hypothetical protein Vretifemale_7385 [Volvox reticuliferus]GIM01769.1 hypothetical protein Vretimale_6557 [Volvox reticuliferus]